MNLNSREDSSTSQPNFKASPLAHLSKKSVLIIIFIILSVVALDQVSKSIVVAQLPVFPAEKSSIEVIGDFLRITHLTNDAVLFSIGRNLGDTTKRLLFTMLPLLVLGWLVYILFFDKMLSRASRYAFALVAGGGFGNLSDRIFRGGAVVDFVDIRFYGIFGFERWPTFNVADSAVVVGTILFIIFLFTKKGAQSAQ